ncbi:MAG: 2,3-bisphosphoglycerate-independent phosphoglycerate mutase [Candidatus Dadabacteria bacterium]|nr:2,3-bisphosphoglycerate-independent phosphoglycerate mutase [Candidatus Dadabacteria bacterium]
MQEVIKKLLQPNNTKIVFCVLDGVGGLPQNGKTELEAAKTPNLDALAQRSACGQHLPVAYGITPGSGAAHLGLFGYDPLKYEIGRGVLEALGLGIQLTPNDLAIRGNFATVKYEGDTPIITNRRAGRISTEENIRIVSKITEKIKEIDGVKVNMTSGMEHRSAIIFTFPEPIREGGDAIADTDPQLEGVSPIPPTGNNPEAQKVADVVGKFINQVAEIIRDEKRANYILLRGSAVRPSLASYQDAYGLNAACIATYPMYRGVAKLVGMEVLEVEDHSIKSEIDTLKRDFDKHDFFYFHVKKTDSYGEDGNFDGKVGVIEEFDSFVPDILKLNPDVIVVTGDHSTPANIKAHSWHPVPILINAKNVRAGVVEGFGEADCLKGELGTFRSVDLMTLVLAHAGRLQKYGA